MDAYKIGQHIKKLRIERGWSQYELAEKIPITRQSVSKWECGKTTPDSSTFIILSKIFGVSIRELMIGDEDEEEQEVKIQDVALSILDENISKTKKIKKVMIINGLIILTILILFLVYYFITSYNSIKFYIVNGSGENFTHSKGILIITKEKFYFQSGKIIPKDENINIDKIDIYYSYKGKEKLIFSGNDNNFLISDYYGYNLLFKYNDINEIVKNLYLVITYNETEKEKINLKLTNDFSNNKIFSNKSDLMIKNKESKSTIDEIDKIKEPENLQNVFNETNKEFNKSIDSKSNEKEKNNSNLLESNKNTDDKNSATDNNNNNKEKDEENNSDNKNEEEENKYPDILFYIEHKDLLINLIKKNSQIEENLDIKTYTKKYFKNNTTVTFTYSEDRNLLDIYAESENIKYECYWMLKLDLIKLSTYKSNTLIDEINISKNDLLNKTEKYNMLSKIIFQYLEIFIK